jgi:hypothetical protein
MFSAASKTDSGTFGSGEAIFTNTAGASWVVPAGVTSISAVCIGGGGGGCQSTSAGGGGSGGDLRYYNNLSVTPGETLTITVGTGGAKGATGTAGGFSRIARSGTTLLEAAGGGGGTTAAPGAKNGTSTTIAGSVGGGDGGAGGTASGTVTCSGGGGAGGYSGAGGAGAAGTNTGANAAANSGAGGGGGGGGDTDTAGAGGGVNVFGIGLDGVGGAGTTANGHSATGGSYGDGGLDNGSTGTASFLMVPNFGGGGGGDDNAAEAGNGGQGVVRVVWPGTSCSFPSTNVWMSSVITTVIETQASTGTSITIPASAQAGDLAVLMNNVASLITPTNPSGWTRIINQNAAIPVMTVWYRILQSGDAGTTVTMTGGTTPSTEMIVLRKASGSISSVSVSGGTIQNAAGIPTTQTQNASTATAPFIVFGCFSPNAGTTGTSDMYFTGGVAGSGNVEPSYAYSGLNGDTSREAFMRFRIYDTAPLANVDVVCRRDVLSQTMGSFIIQVT